MYAQFLKSNAGNSLIVPIRDGESLYILNYSFYATKCNLYSLFIAHFLISHNWFPAAYTRPYTAAFAGINKMGHSFLLSCWRWLCFAYIFVFEWRYMLYECLNKFESSFLAWTSFSHFYFAWYCSVSETPLSAARKGSSWPSFWEAANLGSESVNLTQFLGGRYLLFGMGRSDPVSERSLSTAPKRIDLPRQQILPSPL